MSGTSAADPGTGPGPDNPSHEQPAGTGAGVPDGAGRRWSIVTTSGCTATGYLPGWAVEDPSATGVPPAGLHLAVSEVSHHAPFPGQRMPVTCDTGPAQEAEVFRGGIDCDPYAEGPEPPVPVVNLQIVDDYWVYGLNPEQLAGIAAKLRAQADRLDHAIRPALIAARTEWAAHHATP